MKTCRSPSGFALRIVPTRFQLAKLICARATGVVSFSCETAIEAVPELLVPLRFCCLELLCTLVAPVPPPFPDLLAFRIVDSFPPYFPYAATIYPISPEQGFNFPLELFDTYLLLLLLLIVHLINIPLTPQSTLSFRSDLVLRHRSPSPYWNHHCSVVSFASRSLYEIYELPLIRFEDAFYNISRAFQCAPLRG